MNRLKLLAILALIASLPAVAEPGTTGLSGTVNVSPARPGPQLAGAPDVAPMVNALVRVHRADGSEVAHTTTDDQGHFTVPVPPGAYEVGVDVQGAALPRCEVIHALVHDGQLTRVQLMCDSGMR